MKAFLLLLCALFAILTLIRADGCELQGKKLKPGESYSPKGQCLKYTCQEGGGLSALGCAASASLKPCKTIPEDLSKPYPACCERLEC